MATSPGPALAAARSYALVGVVFYFLGALFFGWGLAWDVVRGLGLGYGWPPLAFLDLLGSLIPTALAIGFGVWAWRTLRDVEEGRHAAARSASLILGILGLVLALLVGGIFFLLTYVKLSEVLHPAPGPIARICVGCGRPVDPEAAYCAHCGRQLPA